MTTTITLPWIDPRLHAHTSGNRWSKSRATKELRQYTALLAKQQRPKTISVAVVDYRFFPPDARKRDVVNMMQSTKAAIDGCVDAGIIAGDSWTELSIGRIEVSIDRENPRVELVFAKRANSQ